MIDAMEYLYFLKNAIIKEIIKKLEQPKCKWVRIQLHVCLKLNFEKSKTITDDNSGEQTITWETVSPYFCSEMMLVMGSNVDIDSIIISSIWKKFADQLKLMYKGTQIGEFQGLRDSSLNLGVWAL